MLIKVPTNILKLLKLSYYIPNHNGFADLIFLIPNVRTIENYLFKY